MIRQYHSLIRLSTSQQEYITKFLEQYK